MKKQKLVGYLSQLVDGSSLALFRIFFGLSVFVSFWKHTKPDSAAFAFTYDMPQWRSHYPGFEWLIISNPLVVKGVFIVTSIAALLFAGGIWYRLSAVVLFFGYAIYFFQDTTYFNNHYYLIMILAFLFIWLPADRRFSIPHWWQKDTPPGEIPYWPVILLRVQLLIVYLYGAVAKVDPDFLNGEPIIGSAEVFVNQISSILPVFSSVDAMLVAKLMAWIGLIFDFAIGFLLWNTRTQLLGIALMAAFHGINHITLPIGVFPFLAFTGSLIFLSPDWPVRFWNFLRKPFVPKFNWRVALPWAVIVPGVGLLTGWKLPGLKSVKGPALSNGIFVALIAWVAFQSLAPLKHFFIEGDPSWTEEGQSFSWRMMLRQKTGGSLVYHLKDPAIYVPSSQETSIQWSSLPDAESKGVFVPIDAHQFLWRDNKGINTVFEGLLGYRIIYACKDSSDRGIESEKTELRRWWMEKRGGDEEEIDFAETLPLKDCLSLAILSMEAQPPTDETRNVEQLLKKCLTLCDESGKADREESSNQLDQSRRNDLLTIHDLLFQALASSHGDLVRKSLLKVHPFALVGGNYDQRFLVLGAAQDAGGIQQLSTSLDREESYLIWCDLEKLRGYSWRDLPQWCVVFEQGKLVILWNRSSELNLRQVKKQMGNPLMIHQYAQRIANFWEEKYQRRPEVYAHGVVMMNYRYPQAIIDHEVDLASVDYQVLRHNPWIIPYQSERIGMSRILQKEKSQKQSSR